MAGQALARHPDLDGLVCVNDRFALGAVIRLREEGKRIPADVAVASTTIPNWLKTSSPSLQWVTTGANSAVARSFRSWGNVSIGILPVELIVHASTAAGSKSRGKSHAESNPVNPRRKK